MNAGTPNYEILKDAYAVIDGIPDDQFDLSTIIKKRGNKHECGTIACAAGWLSIHPVFGQKLNAVVESGSEVVHWKVGTYVTRGFPAAFQTLLNVPERDALDLFSMRGDSNFDRYIPRAKTLNDKALWKARVRHYLQLKGQI